MKTFSLQNYLSLFAISLVLLWGCKQPETIIINETPKAVAPADTAAELEANTNGSEFRKLVIGEYNAIPTLDPLFANNSSTMRAIQLIYEGLVRLNHNGAVVPAIAKTWKVDSDSLQYTFIVNRNIYYQDSDVFSTGTGRRVSSSDVRFVFERMAKANTPPDAAQLFMSIEGFEPYYREQRDLFFSKSRNLDGVTGIKTPNDSTVVFELTEQDPEFLKKLATPYAVIYPRESVNGIDGSFSPVGSGPFVLSSQRSDSVFIFAKSDKYHTTSEIKLNRVDVITSRSESNLMRQIGISDIHLLPELGPNMLQNIIAEEGTIKASFANQYELTKRTGADRYILRYNPSADLSKQEADIISTIAHSSTSNYFDQLPKTIISLEQNTDTEDPNTRPAANRLFSVFSDDPFISTYLGSLAQTLEQQDISLQMAEIQIPTRNTHLLVSRQYPFLSHDRWVSYPELFQFSVHPTALYRTEITGLHFNQYGWWLNLRDVSLPPFDKLN